MAEKVLASTMTAPKTFEIREYDMPDVPPDAGLLRVEASGVCGSDVHQQTRMRGTAHILGHEIVGRIAKLGSAHPARRAGFTEGDRVALEEYMPCGACDFCRTDDYRFCQQTDPAGSAKYPMFYGTTPTDIAPSLWGGYSHYLYLHPNCVMHRVPDHLPPALAALFLPMSNGVEWMYRYGDLQLGDTVVVQGPGQQGLAAAVTARDAGADKVIVTGLSRDAHRLALAQKLVGADVIDVEKENFRERVMDLTGGKGVNVVVNVTGGGKDTVADSVAVASKSRCTIVLAAAGNQMLDVSALGRAKIVLKRANGHSHYAVEQAIRLIGSGKYPLEELCTHSYGLKDVGLAIRTVAGDGVPGGIHVSVLPWN